MINKNKKFIKESFSFQPKYVKNKFLNLVLTFRQTKTINDIKITIIVHIYLLVLKIQNLVISELFKSLASATFITGTNNKHIHNTNKYAKNIFSCKLNLLNLCQSFSILSEKFWFFIVFL